MKNDSDNHPIYLYWDNLGFEIEDLDWGSFNLCCTIDIETKTILIHEKLSETRKTIFLCLEAAVYENFKETQTLVSKGSKYNLGPKELDKYRKKDDNIFKRALELYVEGYIEPEYRWDIYTNWAFLI